MLSGTLSFGGLSSWGFTVGFIFHLFLSFVTLVSSIDFSLASYVMGASSSVGLSLCA